ncbi:MAG: hypothetical protein IPJ19_07110 [Planctomycetes bacterium]|nr:hypothetical protein [Planctomycetota bacterium]
MRPRGVNKENNRLYKIWFSIHARCEKPNDRGYPYNGALGIKVAAKWSNFEPFRTWVIAAGSKPGLWLTRIDHTKDYSPKNCIWSSSHDVLRKRKPASHAPVARRPLRALGETKALLAWARDPRCSVTASTIAKRLDRGWDAKSAITAPPQTPGCRGTVFTKVRAFGQVKGPAAWSRDKRCRVTKAGLSRRLRRGWDPERAITTPAYGLRGRP